MIRSARVRLAVGVLAVVLGPVLGPALAPALAGLPSAAAATEEQVLGVLDARVGEDGLEVLTPVPAAAEVDLDAVSVTVAGAAVPATAAADDAGRDDDRTTVLVLDTGRGTSREQLRAITAGVLGFVGSLPEDVAVGVVSAGEDATTVLEPTPDRGEVRAALAGLEPSRGTSLYAAAEAAVATLAGPVGADPTAPGGSVVGSVVAVAAGPDTTQDPMSEVLVALQQEQVRLDVVTVGAAPGEVLPMRVLASVGGGEVLQVERPAGVQRALGAVMTSYDSRVRVVADLPPGASGEQEVVVRLPQADGATLRATTRVDLADRPSVQAETEAAALSVRPPSQPGLDTSTVLAWSGVAALGLGLLGVLVALVAVPQGPDREERLREQLQAYGVFGAPVRDRGQDPAAPADGFGGRTKQAVEQALGQAGLEAAVASRLEAAGMRLKPAEWVLLHGGIVIGSFTLLLLLGGGSLVPALLGLLLGALGPWVYLGMRKGRRLKAFSAGLPDTLQLMSGSLSAGLSLAQSIDTIVREGAEPISGEFRRVVTESRLGVPLEDSLDGVGERMQSQDFEWVVMAIRIQREVGGNLAELLLQVAATLREREFLRRHVRALSAEGRLSAWILGGLPPGFLLYLTLTKPDYTNVLWTDPRGWIMLAGMAVLMVGGVTWMVKAAKVDF